MTTPVEQFVEDFTLVVDNDQEAYNEARECASAHIHLHEVSDCMREQYETAISAALEVLRESDGVEAVTVNLMSQILLGWGVAPFDSIARHYMEKGEGENA
jgi:hypothetical protein